jgi:hypothetical protein
VSCKEFATHNLLLLRFAKLHRGEVGNAESQEIVERDGAEAFS